MPEDKKPLNALQGLLGLSTAATTPAGMASRGLGLGLADLLRRPVKGLYYNGKTIILDGYQFVGCRFDNCVLKVTSSDFELLDCVIDPSTRIEYGGGLQKVIQLFTGRYPWAAQTFPPGFIPTKGSNGAESIKDARG